MCHFFVRRGVTPPIGGARECTSAGRPHIPVGCRSGGTMARLLQLGGLGFCRCLQDAGLASFRLRRCRAQALLFKGE